MGNHVKLIMQIVGNCLTVDTRQTISIPGRSVDHQHALDRGKQQLVQLRQHFVHGEGLSTTPPSSQAIFGRTLVVVGGQCAHDWLAAHEPGSTHQDPVGIDHPGNREALYRRTAEISPPGRSSRCGGVLIGRP
jgi:hypothetical protein